MDLQLSNFEKAVLHYENGKFNVNCFSCKSKN